MPKFLRHLNERTARECQGHFLEEGTFQVEAYMVHPSLKILWFSEISPWQEDLEVDLLIAAD